MPHCRSNYRGGCNSRRAHSRALGGSTPCEPKWVIKSKDGYTSSTSVVGTLSRTDGHTVDETSDREIHFVTITEAESSDHQKIGAVDQVSATDREAERNSFEMATDLQEAETKTSNAESLGAIDRPNLRGTQCDIEQPQPADAVADERQSVRDDLSSQHDFDPSETLIIFDWDDTIMPTSWIQKNQLCDRLGENQPNHTQITLLENIAHQADQLLTLSGTLGEVVIITNAESGWIEYSCQRFMKNLEPTLQSVRIVSARSTYESSFPEDGSTSRDWKTKAFEAEAARFFQNKKRRRNILSFGDSLDELAALESVGERWTGDIHPGSYAKSVKLKLKPSPYQLQQQLSELTAQVYNLVQYQSKLDLYFGDSEAPAETAAVEKIAATTSYGGERIKI